MAQDQVESNLHGMDELDFTGWNNADRNGVFAHHVAKWQDGRIAEEYIWS